MLSYLPLELRSPRTMTNREDKSLHQKVHQSQHFHPTAKSVLGTDMVMKNDVKYIDGITSTRSGFLTAIPREDGSGLADLRWVYSHTTQNDTRGYTALTSVLSSSGDRRTPNNHHYVKLKQNYSWGTERNSTENTLTERRGAIDGAFALPGPGKANATAVYNEALSRVYDKLRDGVDLSVAAFEAQSTARMVRQVTKLTNYVRSFHPKQWGRKWLEYQYGWRPLVNDVYKTAHLILNYESKQGVQKVSARANETFVESIPQEAPATGETKTTSKVRVQFITFWGLDETDTIRASSFTSLNPASIAWELVPFSFVADWVYDIGGYLRSTETAYLNRARYYKGTVSIGRKCSVVSDFNLSTTSGTTVYHRQAKADAEYTEFSRAVLESAPYPYPPQFKVNLGSQRLLSAASLLSLHLGGGGRPR